MVFPIHGPQGAKATDKAKTKPRVGAAGGPSFAEALAEAQEAGQPAQAALPNTLVGAYGGGVLPSFIPETTEELPQDTRGQTAQLLKNLRELADVALGGSFGGSGGGTPHMARLQALASASATDEASLTPDQRSVVAEARTRAAVEAAKGGK